jgi:hypothetical protein
MPPHVSSVNSVGNGPHPTRVVYAFMTPSAQSTLSGDKPKPVPNREDTEKK